MLSFIVNGIFRRMLPITITKIPFIFGIFSLISTELDVLLI